MLHHIELYVSDLQRTALFWEGFLTELGYEIYQKWDKGISFRHETAYLVFVQADERFMNPPYDRRRVGLNHLAFHAQSREQVDKVTAMLKVRGVQILYPDKHPYAGGVNHYAVYFEDPDRIKVELVAPEL
ncbi:VOC family protein [Mesobacillus zeae]|uniref:VOC domain-containing protein n=1 Tax=Mesobacillus zeae TaxID=1917180 RepID=A0A398B2G1_9BACI|nr:VOC family protein [Mesobacillus zeae]RID83962.1 hypothetical protein D1970_15325 [Mesobacillus zeae]